MKMSFLYIFIAFLLSCSKGGVDNPTPPAPPPVVIVDTLPPQYGTPFANVPAGPDATIYQVNMRSFSAAGNLEGVVARLDSIKA